MDIGSWPSAGRHLGGSFCSGLVVAFLCMMTDSNTIQILPELVANQIAAGEVVQRPSSVVKELLENAVDAGASEIGLWVEEAGRTLIKVSDNGTGMNAADLKLAFERHATSKIRSAEDLFKISSRGFRGEALASIAAVAQVEAKSRMKKQEMGSQLTIEGGTVVESGLTVAAEGTEISVRNLFFNIPARRNFLKSDAIEFRHICDEFQRVALAHPEIAFLLIHGDATVYHLQTANRKRRIVGIMGAVFDERLVPVEEETPLLQISGYIGKPEYSKKTRGEQFLFVNDRFIRSNRLHHAILQAFEGILPDKRHPAYFLFLQIDPAHIDVNIHPTKTEIQFDDERTVYGLLKASVRHAIGQFNISPVIDFDTEASFQPPTDPNRPIRPPVIQVDPHFNPFDPPNRVGAAAKGRRGTREWTADSYEAYQKAFEPIREEALDTQCSVLPWNDRFLLQIETDRMRVVDTARAHTHLLYVGFCRSIEEDRTLAQQLLFPLELTFKAEEIEHLSQMLPEMLSMGFDAEPKGGGQIDIRAIPYGTTENAVRDTLDELIQTEGNSEQATTEEKRERLAAALARKQAVKSSHSLNGQEAQALMGSMDEHGWPQLDRHGNALWWEVRPEQLIERDE